MAWRGQTDIWESGFQTRLLVSAPLNALRCAALHCDLIALWIDSWSSEGYRLLQFDAIVCFKGHGEVLVGPQNWQGWGLNHNPYVGMNVNKWRLGVGHPAYKAAAYLVGFSCTSACRGTYAQGIL